MSPLPSSRLMLPVVAPSVVVPLAAKLPLPSFSAMSLPALSTLMPARLRPRPVSMPSLRPAVKLPPVLLANPPVFTLMFWSRPAARRVVPVALKPPLVRTSEISLPVVTTVLSSTATLSPALSARSFTRAELPRVRPSRSASVALAATRRSAAKSLPALSSSTSRPALMIALLPEPSARR